MLHTYIKRLDSQLLDIMIEYSVEDVDENSHDDAIDRAVVSGVAHLLWPHINRWRSLHMITRMIETFCTILPPSDNFMGEAPALCRLVLASTGASDLYMHPLIFKAPALCHSALVGHAYHSLNNLVLTLPSVEELLLFDVWIDIDNLLLQLSSLKHLRSLSITNPSGLYGYGAINLGRLDAYRLPALERLQLRGTSIESINNLFSSLDAPLLHSIALSHIDNGHFELDTPFFVIQNSSRFPAMRALHFVNVPFEEDLFDFTPLTFCSHLTLELEPQAKLSFFDALSHVQTEYPWEYWLLPAMEVLEVRATSWSVAAPTPADIRRMIEARHDAGQMPVSDLNRGPKSVALRELHITFTYQILKEDREWLQQNLDVFTWEVAEVCAAVIVLYAFL